MNKIAELNFNGNTNSSENIVADNPQHENSETPAATPKPASTAGCGDVAGNLPESVKPSDYASREEFITRLAQFDPFLYERVRVSAAKNLKVRISFLDDLVEEKRKELKAFTESNISFEDIEPWQGDLDPAELLSEIESTVRKHIICSKENSVSVTLWIAMTWVIDSVRIAPLAVITAPEKRCGKTQLLSLIGNLCCRPLAASNITSAALFRSIELFKPTILIDEADTFVKGNEELRGLINCGHTRESAFIIRTTGESHTPTRFNVWGAKAISGIGKLQDTLMDRAIVISLRRKLPHETAERLRNADSKTFKTISSKLARFAADYSKTILTARPHLPEGLNDRAQDNWEPLLSIADCVGGDWPGLARDVALKMSGSYIQKESIGTELLRDIQKIFEEKEADRISSKVLIESLCHDHERPWSNYHNDKPISAHQLAELLREYGIQSKSVRIGSETPKGFMKSQFEEAFVRYLSPEVENSATTPQCSIDEALHVSDEVQPQHEETPHSGA